MAAHELERELSRRTDPDPVGDGARAVEHHAPSCVHRARHRVRQGQAIHHEIDVNTQEQRAAGVLPMNHIGRVRVALTEPIAFDAYPQSPATGALA